MGNIVSSVTDFANPLSKGFLNMGGVQEQHSGSRQEKSSFAQFPDLQKAIAQFGFENVQSLAQPLANRINLPTPYDQLGATGLLPQQEQAFRTAVAQAMGSSSSDFARRGMLNPEHIGAIAGSAAQNVAPRFLELIGGNALVPEQVTQNRINQLMQLISTYPGLLGGMATQITSGQTNFPNFFQSVVPAIAGGAAQGLSSPVPAGGQSAFCWIAMELYGTSSPKVVLIRWWLLSAWPTWSVNLYRRYGVRIVHLMRHHRLIRWTMHTLFDRLARGAMMAYARHTE
jgi:hypothetical protein